MSQRDRVGGPPGVARPFVPTASDDLMRDIAEALDHIARALSAIDHNLEVLIAQTHDEAAAVVRVAASLKD